MGFWADTWETIKEQAALGPPGGPGRATPEERDAWEKGAQAALGGAAENFVELARTATSPSLWGWTPEAIEAYEEGVRGLPDQVAGKAKDLWTVAGWLTKPWVLAVIGGAVVLFIAAPYAAPFLKRS